MPLPSSFEHIDVPDKDLPVHISEVLAELLPSILQVSTETAIAVGRYDCIAAQRQES